MWLVSERHRSRLVTTRSCENEGHGLSVRKKEIEYKHIQAEEQLDRRSQLIHGLIRKLDRVLLPTVTGDILVRITGFRTERWKLLVRAQVEGDSIKPSFFDVQNIGHPVHETISVSAS